MSAEQSQIVDSIPLSPPIDYQFLGDNETVEKKRRAVEGYRLKASLYHAAQFAGCARASIYRWLESDPEFQQAMADAHEDSADVMETSTYEEALGTAEKPGNALLKMFWLKAHRPKYRDKVTVDVSDVQRQIDEMMARVNGIERQQLPAAITSFIDTDYSQQQAEYVAVGQAQPLQFHDACENQQKEESPDLSDPRS